MSLRRGGGLSWGRVWEGRSWGGVWVLRWGWLGRGGLGVGRRWMSWVELDGGGLEALGRVKEGVELEVDG